jgi:hypothetical protein
MRLIAHAGELHVSVVESAGHWFEPWYVQVGIFAGSLLLVGAISKLFTKHSAWILLGLAITSLMAGFGLYSVAPIISILSLSCGLVVSMLLTIIGLSGGEQKSGEE